MIEATYDPQVSTKYSGWVFAWVSCCAIAACGAPSSTADGGDASTDGVSRDDGGSVDGADATIDVARDTASMDSGASDTGALDAGAQDARATDTSNADGALDSGSFDAGSTDASADGGAPLVWFPGHYLLVNDAESWRSDHTAGDVTALLTTPDGRRFTGVEVKLLWRDFEPMMDSYDFAILDAVLDAAANAGPCTAGDGSPAPCRVHLQVQYKTADWTLPAVPDYLLSTGAYCDANPGVCRISADPAARSALQQTFCATTGAQRCGAHEAPQESLAMLWLPGVASRFQRMLGQLEAHVLASPHADLLSGYALPETTFDYDPTTSWMVDEGYSIDLYVAALKSNMLASHAADPSRVTFQFVGNIPPIGRDIPTWTAAVQDFYDFASMNPGLGIGHPDVAPLLTPLTNGYTSNPALVVMQDTAYWPSVPRNPNTQNPDITDARTPDFATSYDLVVNRVRGNYVAWSTAETSSRGTVLFTWHDVAAYIATHPLPAANLAPPAW